MREEIGRRLSRDLVQSQAGLLLPVVEIMEKKMETTVLYWGYTGIMEKKMETTVFYGGYSGIMEKKMETTVLYLYTGIMEKKMETTIGD